MHKSAKSVLAAVLLCTGTTALSQVITGDDIVLTDISPSIAFDDTDSVGGNNWVMRGDNGEFSIFDVDEAQFAFYIEPVKNTIALGYDSSASGFSSQAFGRFTTAPGDGGIAIGPYANAASEASSAIGLTANALGAYSTAIGPAAQADAAWSVVLGATKGVNDAPLYSNVGVGTTAPIQAVDVERSGAAARFQLTSYTNVSNEAPQYIQRRSRGTTLAPDPVQANDNLGLFSFRGYNGTTMGGSRATITAQAAGNFSNSSTPTRLIFATTPVGSTTPQQVMVITPDGKVQVNGQNLNVPDYVFEDDYELMPLEELQAFIDENGHLPGIAPAHEVNENGHDLAGSDMAQLRKIEELTLYTLQQNERIERLEAELRTVRAEQREFLAAMSRLQSVTASE